jgi:hypothetical protein
MNLERKFTYLADTLVDGIARHKARMLAGAIMLAAALAFIALFIALEGHGHGLTDVVVKLGGYVAIAGLVLGIPALGYAMVTDRAVEELTFGLGLTRGELRRVEADIDKIVRTAKLPPEHYAQVFVPNRQRTRLMPIYDPEAVGPEEGWEVNASTPQAITGSAWQESKHLFAMHDELKDKPKLRLTPDQVRRFADLTGVAAVPIRFRAGSHGRWEKVGVLTIFTSAATPLINQKWFIEEHRKLASALTKTVVRHVAVEGPLDFGAVTPTSAAAHDVGTVAWR